MSLADNLAKLTANCVSFAIELNGHALSYWTLSEMFKYEPDHWSDREANAACIQAGRIYSLQVYPNTPVGFNFYYGPDLEALVAKAVENL